ncbi:HypC/HybG/HupF family hydrogenase formation chaperone [Methylocystis sp. JR02]|uniref:HypC/HybG/HupF family hydrogenase formation chaperone n=1 Tax=Methylocystis sp. JR02 TaxID=3046284 RepID=UPI0024B89981|nr:HypC/HybG/HupF family hydrogenase formation chaperone [Methylocystis sp. JR02]MDJ0448774.1 HypC/HybG/HupF family hydrogenase formation chaperone [Methylocystis sp. JR02]
MCLGFPMTVLSGDDARALCERKGETQSVSMLLVGAQTPGTKVLVHLGTAMRVLDAEEAQSIDDALDGLEAALSGGDFEQYFADLIDREPQLPDFLRDQK